MLCNQGSHISQNEFDFLTQVPLNVLDFKAVFLTVLVNIFSVLLCECSNYSILLHGLY